MLRRLCGLALLLTASASLCAGPLTTTWQRERLDGGSWTSDQSSFFPAEDGTVVVTRGAPHHARISAVVEADLARTPRLRIVAHAANAQWKLTGSLDDGPEVVIADRQCVGEFSRDLRPLLGEAAGTLSLRLHIWGWGNGAHHYVRLTPSLEAVGADSDARALLGEMAAIDARAAARAAELSSEIEGHPRLRFDEETREAWRAKAHDHPELAEPITTIIAEINERRDEEPYVLTAESYLARRPAWGENLLSVRPPEPPELLYGTGADPFPGLDAWRQLYWHDFSLWLLGAALSDEPDFVEQARRWSVALARHRFWLQSDYIYFDFDTSYPLQCLCTAYDVACNDMSDAERRDVQQAIATLADGLYRNTISGHGAIYNDLRGNHTAVTMCGLGMAGLTLLGEDERAGRWVALAERFMLDSFEEHTSGAWLESPSYGAYGVNEWLRFAEMLRNVTGQDHLSHPFLRRFAQYQLHVADWEGRDLGYNGGGAGEYWNQWVFHAIAREFRDERFQWLGNPTGDVGGHGYGDRFWWVDPDLPARRPTETLTGRHFADIGLSVWRSGWDDDATILLHHCGMKGQHKEENMNHITLYALGQRFLPDGIGGATSDHNVPIIDTRSQNKWMPGATLAYHCDDRAGYALGDSQSAYFGSRRHVLFLRPDIVVLVDELDPGDGAHTVRFMLHPSGDVTADDGLLRVRSGGATLQALTALPDATVLPMTATERDDQRRATHDAWATYEGVGPVLAATVLLVSPTPEPPIPEVEATETGLRIEHGERVFALGLKAGEIAPGFETTSPLWLARITDDGPQAILAPGLDEMGDTVSELRTPAGIVSGNPTVTWSP